MRLSETVFFIALAIFTVEGQLTEDVTVGKPLYLWRINSSPPSYLFGTIHVPYTLVWDSVSEEVNTAFNSALQVYFEVGNEDPDISCAMLSTGQTISQVGIHMYYCLVCNTYM